MCGIYGYVGTPKKPAALFKFMKILAVLSEERGIDGCGFFAIDEENITVEKTAARAQEFMKVSEHMKSAIVDKKASIFVGHNRQASQGEVKSVNAHPFVGDNWAMVHNGTIGQTAFDLAKKHKVLSKIQGNTDSEAFFRVVDKLGFTGELLKEIECYALVAVNYHDRKIFFAKDNHRPLCIFDLRKTLGVRVFCSTRPLVFDTIRYTNKYGVTNINLDKVKFWYLKNLHMYTMDMETLEAENLGRYEEDPEPDTSPVTIQQAINTGKKLLGYGRRGYPAPATAIGNEPPKKKSAVYGE